MAMTRGRTLRPELFRDEDLIALPIAVRLTAIGLRVYANDHGRESATAALIKAALWPLDRDVTEAVVDDHLLALAGAGYLDLYTAGSRLYFAIVDWPRVDRPTDSNIPSPPPRESLANASRMAPDSFGVVEREGEGEREGEREQEREPSRTSREDVPPSPFCHTHPEGTDTPCRNCGTARLRHKKHTDQLLTDTTPRFMESD